MKESTIQKLAPLLRMLRSYEILEEVRETKFHLNGRDFIHFHDEPDGLFADVLLAKGRIRASVSSRSEQAELMERIHQKLDALESHGPKKRGGKHE